VPVAAGARAARRRADGSEGRDPREGTNRLFPSPQFPSASKASVFAQRSEGRKLERRLLLMRFHGEGAEMRVELPSWLGNRERGDILSLLRFNIFTALFFNGPSARD